MRLKAYFTCIALLSFVLSAAGENVNFDKFFCDSTLRLDYTFTGNACQQMIGLKNKFVTENWAGRRHNLQNLPLKGNGELIMTDSISGKVIYATSFSSLFIEWLDTDEAKSTTISMEHTVLVPMPKRTVMICVKLYNHRGETTSVTYHPLRPDNILIRRPDTGHTTPHKYIHYSGSPKDKIDVAILGEGYSKEETDSFYVHAQKAVNSILSHEPFKSMADRFNFVAVESVSEDSGLSSPSEYVWKRTCFDSHYDTFYSKRYLTTTSTSLIHDVLIGIPYEHIIILANTDQYGGGGIYNSYTLTTAKNPNFWPVVTHEFGHSFGGLADEYFYDHQDVMQDTYPLDIEPWEQNVTTLVDFKSKWADMIDNDTPIPTPVTEENTYKVGVYEGAAYATKGVYRPLDRCRMRDNKVDYFCPVCQRAISRIIKFYTE